ncbi:unnamed protein product [Sphenostylis stenocarpa]|uniref:Uncharacterized protein n=1 Tax=Sphenostylis stenocarpa TaxID=92480 RepID=A0AA86SVV3_9FABA|nr:unnamed protein product [Sphenostylis stenocarpa]
MEGNDLSHNMPTWSSRKLITPQSYTSFSLIPNECLKNNTQECKSSDTRDNDDKVKDHEEGHSVEKTGREKLKRLREEVTMEKVNIPEDWGQEQKLKDWMDYTMFDAFFAPHNLIVSARDALVANACKAKSRRLRI